ncbi:MAG TPA: dihydrolipoyl dehydrogenase [Thiobacillus sp.]
MSELLDVIIIGAGTAGLTALRAVKKHTERFVIVNDGPYGTTCARVGCMPSKVLIEAANAFHRRHTLEAFGIRGSAALTADIPAVLRRVRELRDSFVAFTLKATDQLGDRNIAGRARLLGPNRVEVNGQELTAKRIIIATGSRPIVPPPWRALGDRVLTTDTLFEQENLAPRIAVVGMGPIGIEVAQALSRLGIEIIGFSAGQHLAGLTDPTINETLFEQLKQEFVIHRGSKAELFEDADGIRVSNGKTRVVADQVIAALGRQPNLDGLGLEHLGVTLDTHGMPPINLRTMQIADLPIYLAGDANGKVPLLHEASDEGYIAGINALAEAPAHFVRRTPLGIVFVEPNIAFVGKRYEELDPDTSITGTVSFDDQGRARAAQRNAGLMHLYADKRTGELLGAEMCVPAGEHMAHLLALAIGRQLTVNDLLRMPFYHPVLEEGLRTALRDLANQLPDAKKPDLDLCNVDCAAAGD